MYSTSGSRSQRTISLRGDPATIAVESIANYWWARYLERVNVLAPLIIDKVERDGAKRGSLARYLRILSDSDGNRCFYCERDLGAVRAVHVDHVIPWSFLLSDPAWDLVLACVSCNLKKSDILPARIFIDKLSALHVDRAKLSLASIAGSAFLQKDEVDRYYDAALSVEWPSGWEPVTDPDWLKTLAETGASEVNFWQPRLESHRWLWVLLILDEDAALYCLGNVWLSHRSTRYVETQKTTT